MRATPKANIEFFKNSMRPDWIISGDWKNTPANTERIKDSIRGWGGRTGRYPSGRPSRGGANRSSNIKRVIAISTRKVNPCPACGGVSPDVRLLTEVWPVWDPGCPAEHDA